jgi:hypothetical protein
LRALFELGWYPSLEAKNEDYFPHFWQEGRDNLS